MNIPRPTFNVEDELTAAIVSIGGRRVGEFLGRVPGHENADYYFQAASVVAELKCLDEDKIHDERIIEKASQIYDDELQSGRAPVVVFGEVHMTTEEFSEEYKEKIANLYRIPIERLVRKADSQIARTVEALKIAKPTGLFLLANNNHTALDPQHIWHIVNQILTQKKYSSISSAVIFSGNLGAGLPGNTNRIDYWIEVQRGNVEPADTEFLVSLREAWHAHLAKVLGKSSDPVTLRATANFLSILESQ